MADQPAVSRSQISESLANAVDLVLERLSHGQVLDAEILHRDFPECAPQLEAMLPTMIAMVDLGQADQFDGVSSPGVEPRVEQRMTLGDFRLLRELGRGGMGVVYEAEQITLGRRVAVKVLPFAALLDRRSLERFKNEARAAAMLKHPNIVSVYSIGSERGVHFYAMELIDGPSLAHLIGQIACMQDRANQREVNVEETVPTAALTTEYTGNRATFCRHVARLGQQAAQALHFAHDRGVIHRDVKPSNLLMDQDGQLNVADFGLARIQTADELTLTGDVVGTLRYMSPEQIEGRPVDQRTDIYSLGITLYELISQRHPFPEENRNRLIQQILEQPALPLDRVESQVPRDLATIVAKCLRKRADDRYATAADLSEDLQRFLDHRVIMARRPSSTEHVRRWVRRNPIVSVLGCIVALLVLLLAVVGPLVAYRQTLLSHALLNSQQRLRAELYDQEIAVAFDALDDGALERVDEILQRYLPTSGQPDRRGFEWYYLWQQSRRGLAAPQVREWISIWDVVVSPDGRHVAYGVFDGRVHVLDAVTANRQWGSKADKRRGHINSIAISPDSRLLASAGNDKKVIFWDLESGEQLYELGGLAQSVHVVAFSPGSQLFAIGYGGIGQEYTAPASVEVFRWALAEGDGRATVELTRLHEFADLVGRVKSLAFSCDGQFLAAGCHDAMVRLWDSESGQALPSLQGHGRMVTAIAFSPTSPHEMASVTTLDGSRIASDELILWNLDSREFEVLEGHGGQTRDLCFSPDGSLLASCGLDGVIRLWDTDRLIPVDTIRGHSAAVHGVSFFPDGDTLVSCSTDTTVRFWQLSARPPPSVIAAHRHYVYGLAFGPKGQYLVTTGIGSPSAEVKAWNSATGTAAGTAFQASVHLSYDIDVSNDGHTIAVSGGEWPDTARDGELSLWDFDTGRKRRTLVQGPLIWAAEFSPNSQQIVGTVEDRLVFWDVNTGKKLSEIPGQQGSIRNLDWSPDGRFIASCSRAREGMVKVWDAATRQCLWTSELPQSLDRTFTVVAFSRDSRQLAASGLMNDIFLWQLGEDGKRTGDVQILKGHTDVVWGLDFTPDGRRLASSSKDGTVRLWNLETGSELTALRDHHGWCWPCRFSPDGNTLAVGYGGFSWDGWIRLYRAANARDVDPGAPRME